MITVQFATFAIVGATAALVNVVARILLSKLFPYEVAVALAFPIALTFAFLLNRSYVFRSSVLTLRVQYFRFLLINVVALVQVWGVSVGLARYVFPWLNFTWHADTVAHIIGVASPIATSYFMHKRFSFR